MADSHNVHEEPELFAIYPQVDHCDINSVDIHVPCVVNNNSSSYTGVATSIINNNGVINLSSYELSEAEHSLLSKGSSFSPTPGTLDMDAAMNDLDKFHRSLRLATRFLDSDDSESHLNPVDDEPFHHTKFKGPSTYNPRGPPALECFILSNHVHAIQLPGFHKVHKSNLSTAEQTALTQLSKNRMIVIKPADKGGGLVIMNTCDYIHEAHRQLNDTKFYRKLSCNPTSDIETEVSNIVRKMWLDNEIGLDCKKYLLPENTKPGRFYMLPKIHKNKLPPPGRPIVSASGSPTEKISEFLDHFLQPLLVTIPSYIKDTTHFLRMLSELPPLPDNLLLITLDVTSLYTNILLSKARVVLKNYLDRHRTGPEMPTNISLIKLLNLVFTKNIFTFSNGKSLEHYLQINGVSMGSKCAPSVACLYMADFEEKVVYKYHLQPLLWLRYIDDIFILWQHGSDEFDKFVDFLNSNDYGLEFTRDGNSIKVNFLDTTVTQVGERLETEMYIKPTSSLSYLHRSSCHPAHVFKSLPYGEFLRARRNCSQLESFDRFSSIIKEAFINRGYDPTELDLAITKARDLDRKDLLKPKETPPTDISEALNDAILHDDVSFNSTHSTDEYPKPRESRIILNHHPDNKKFIDIIRKNWDHIGTCNKLLPIHAAGFSTGTRRNPRIRDLLIKSSLPVRNKKGFRGVTINECSKAICGYCDMIDTTGEIHSTTLRNRKFDTKKHVCCRSSNLVYCLQCKVCGIQYVGETLRPFRKRLYQHSRNILNGVLDDPIGAHFNSPGHTGHYDQIRAFVLSFITTPPKTKEANDMRKKFENRWIYKLRTSLPYGLNSKTQRID